MNSDKDIFQMKWGEFRQNILDWQSKRSDGRLVKVNLVRERSINILQQRYGYTRDEATRQLDKYYSKAWLG